MTKTIVITDADAVLVLIDPAGDGADKAQGVAGRGRTRRDGHVDVQGSPRTAGGGAGRRGAEDAAIDAEDALTQADEAGALDPVG